MDVARTTSTRARCLVTFDELREQDRVTFEVEAGLRGQRHQAVDVDRVPF